MKADTGLIIRSWYEWQERATRDVKRGRAERGEDVFAPYALRFFACASSFQDKSRNFFRFSAILGDARAATAFWVRLLQYAATFSPFYGEIIVRREHFAHVISSELDPVCQELGEKVYDALLRSKLCVSSSPQALANIKKKILWKVEHRGHDKAPRGTPLKGGRAASRTKGHAGRQPERHAARRAGRQPARHLAYRRTEEDPPEGSKTPEQIQAYLDRCIAQEEAEKARAGQVLMEGATTPPAGAAP